MKINVSKVQNPRYAVRENGTQDINTITGHLMDRPFKISRGMEGWRPQLRIVVDGVTLHSADAHAEEREAFDELALRADSEAMKDRDLHRASLSPISAVLFGK